MLISRSRGPVRLSAKRRFFWPTVIPSPLLPSPSLSPSQRHEEVRMLPPSPSRLALDPRRRMPWVERARCKSTHRDHPAIYYRTLHIRPCCTHPRARPRNGTRCACCRPRPRHRPSPGRRRMPWVENTHTLDSRPLLIRDHALTPSPHVDE